jgi:hypothetical protein
MLRHNRTVGRRVKAKREGEVPLMPRSPAPSVSMTLANMRQQGVRSLSVSCWLCHHAAVLAVDRWADDVPVPSFGPHGLARPAASSATTRGRIGAGGRRGRA